MYVYHMSTFTVTFNLDSAGIKTYDGAIGVDTNKQSVETLLEAAKAKGMVVGMVVTSRVTHATPASFAAHVDSRHKEEEIASQYVNNKNLDFLLGGGKSKFTNEQLQEMRSSGYAVVEDEEGLDSYYRENESSGKLKLFGIFAEHHLAYSVDRHRTKEPSLSKMVDTILKLLSKNPIAQKNGFFLMVEGSRIDHAAHLNDPGAMVHDAIEFDQTVKIVKDFTSHHKSTAMISAADHGTGGLAIGVHGIYEWQPSVLQQTKMSTEYMRVHYFNTAIEACKNENRGCHGTLFRSAQHVLSKYNNINVDDEIEKKLWKAINDLIYFNHSDADLLRHAIASIISEKAQVGWSTSGHVATDVNLYCKGPSHFVQMCIGVHENTHLHHIVSTYLTTPRFRA